MTDRAHAVSERYGADADAYERLWAPVLRPLAQPLVGAMPSDGVARVLDIGSGTGVLIPDIVHKWPGAFVTGADLTHAMLLRAPAEGRCVADARALPFRDAAFDASLSTFVFQHVPDPVVALREARRVLRDAATLGMLTWHEPIRSYEAIDVLNELLDEHGAAPESPIERTRAVENPESLTALLTDAGFSIERRWLDDTVYEMTPASFLERMTGLGAVKRRIETVPDLPRLLEAAQKRLDSLPGRAFAEPLTMIYTVARS